MIHGLAAKMASVFVLYGESSEEDKDIYTYACEAIISTLANILAVLIIALILGRIVDSLIFITIFAFLRKFTGGHHANSHFKCILTLSIIVLSSLILSDLLVNMQMVFFSLLFLAVISSVGIFICAPVGHDNKPVEAIKLEDLKKKGRRFTLLFAIICILVGYIVNLRSGLVIAFAMLFVLISLIYATLSRKFLDS